LNLSESEHKRLLAFSRHRDTPKGILLRVNIILGASEGIANHVLARNLELFFRRCCCGAGDLKAPALPEYWRTGRAADDQKQIPEERDIAIVEATIHTTPKDATHWSIRTMAASHSVSPATVQRIWKKHELQRHRIENFKFSNDPEFAGKVRDIVGLYLNPPDKAGRVERR
jgi:hypothetical protein